MKTIEECLIYIEKQIGLKLQVCDHFIGIKDLKGKKYFNVILKDPTSESVDFTKLTKLSNLYKKIKVEPNGLRRAAIFIN